jgi:hypothetical protein
MMGMPQRRGHACMTKKSVRVLNGFTSGKKGNESRILEKTKSISGQ